MQGTVVTARELNAEMLARVEARLSELFAEPVTLKQQLDPTLLAGIVVYAGGRRFDGSAKGLLETQGEDPSEAEIEAVRGMVIDAAGITDELYKRVSQFSTAPGVRPVGTVLSVGDGIAQVDGLTGCRYNELLDFGDGIYGIAFNLYPESVGAVLLSDSDKIRYGGECMGTGRVVEVPVGDALLGRIVDPLGRPLDGLQSIKATDYYPVESPAEEIIARGPINRPMLTGLTAIDSMVPIGRGQRELIIGDRQTGKTAIAIDTIINQKDQNVICIYVAIGQKASTVVGVCDTLKRTGAMDYTIVVCSPASDPAPMQYLAPYSGCAIGEYFMRAGKDVLIVYDDLSKHAQAYRAISLLLRRPPGREAYPGDVFYLHSRLLERAAQLSPERGGGSMTALPIIETMAGDISAYIPTNVISITDGQIFLSMDLFNSGDRPAVNVGLSVSRVGGSAQTRVMRSVSGQLRLDLAQYRELAVFSQFGSDLDHATRSRLEQGQRLTEMLRQDQYAPYTVAQQVVLLYAVTSGLLSDLDRAGIAAFKKGFMPYLDRNYHHINSLIIYDQPLTEQAKAVIKEAVERYRREA